MIKLMTNLKLTFVLSLLLLSSESFSQSSQVLNYLYSISGKKILAGQHNKEPNSEPVKWTTFIHQTTGKYPALWSGDFLFQQDNMDTRWTMIYEAKTQWENGAVINLMWHACPPDEGEPCAWDPGLLNAQLALALTGRDRDEVLSSLVGLISTHGAQEQ